MKKVPVSLSLIGELGSEPHNPNTPATMSDGTYLEAFIENIGTLPSEIRRNLELMKDMDKSCS